MLPYIAIFFIALLSGLAAGEYAVILRLNRRMQEMLAAGESLTRVAKTYEGMYDALLKAYDVLNSANNTNIETIRSYKNAMSSIGARDAR